MSRTISTLKGVEAEGDASGAATDAAVSLSSEARLSSTVSSAASASAASSTFVGRTAGPPSISVAMTYVPPISRVG